MKAHNEGKKTKNYNKKMDKARQRLKEQIQAQAKKQFPVIRIIQ